MPVFGKKLNVPKSGGGSGGGAFGSVGSFAAKPSPSPNQTAIQQIGSFAANPQPARPKTPVPAFQGAMPPKNEAVPTPASGGGYVGDGGGGGGSVGGGGGATATNPLDNPAYMTFVNELMRQRQGLESTRARDENASDQTYGRNVTRANEEAGRGRGQIDDKWSGRNLTRSGARLDDQQTYQDAVTRQLSDMMLAQQEQRNAIAQQYNNQVNELRRQQAQAALQYGIPLDPNNPTLIPV
jgi:hypothetical protein